MAWVKAGKDVAFLGYPARCVGASETQVGLSPNNNHSYLYILKYPEGKFLRTKLSKQRVCTAVDFLCMLPNYLPETHSRLFALSVVLCEVTVAACSLASPGMTLLIWVLRPRLAFSASPGIYLICINRKGIVAEPFPDCCQAENRLLASGWWEQECEDKQEHGLSPTAAGQVSSYSWGLAPVFLFDLTLWTGGMLCLCASRWILIFQGSLKKQSNSLDYFCQIIKLFDISIIKNRCGNKQFLLFYCPSLRVLGSCQFEFWCWKFQCLSFPGVLSLIYRKERTLEQ